MNHEVLTSAFSRFQFDAEYLAALQAVLAPPSNPWLPLSSAHPAPATTSMSSFPLFNNIFTNSCDNEANFEQLSPAETDLAELFERPPSPWDSHHHHHHQHRDQQDHHACGDHPHQYHNDHAQTHFSFEQLALPHPPNHPSHIKIDLDLSVSPQTPEAVMTPSPLRPQRKAAKAASTLLTSLMKNEIGVEENSAIRRLRQQQQQQQQAMDQASDVTSGSEDTEESGDHEVSSPASSRRANRIQRSVKRSANKPYSPREGKIIQRSRQCIRTTNIERRILLCCNTCNDRQMQKYNPDTTVWYQEAPSSVTVDTTKPCDICGGPLGAESTAATISGYPCFVCGQSFKRGDRLVAHSASHTNVKAFFCSECPRTFSRRARLDEHYLRFHGPIDSTESPSEN